MGALTFQEVSIKGISVCVPELEVDNFIFGQNLFDKETLNTTIETIGVYKRHVSTPEITASDLCYSAAIELFKELNVFPEEIDGLLFVSQTPDYRLPATACVLQNRLGCRKDIIAFDVNLGCSGYVYGLGLSFSLLQQTTVKKILLLVGDTPTKFVSKEDKASVLLFGDGGTATIIEKKAGVNDSFVSFNSDGSGADSLIISGGGYRKQSSSETLAVNTDSLGNCRSMENLFMDGADIFNFTIREVPRNIKLILESADANIEDVDFFVFHQANKFMIDFLARKLKIPNSKHLFSIGKFGNTSSASIPIKIAANKELFVSKSSNVVLSGFGVGFSWSSAFITLEGCEILPIKTY